MDLLILFDEDAVAGPKCLNSLENCRWSLGNADSTLVFVKPHGDGAHRRLTSP